MQNDKNKKKTNLWKEGNRRFVNRIFFVLVFAFIYVFAFFNLALVEAAPQGPASISVDANETKGSTSGILLNISGGRIATINITADQQNPRWKGFVGQVIGTFTLDDSSSSTLYDWTMTNVGGEVYATRNASTPTWTNIRCANNTLLENENLLLNHSNANDNITKTFNGTTHVSFVVGSVTIPANNCSTLNTYKSNTTQDTDFEEMVLTDQTNFSIPNYANLIYATIMESNVVGFDDNTYDFQMIVPEIGLDGYTSATAYYLYVELS